MKLQEKKNGFLLYKSQYGAIKDFTTIQKGKLFDRIFQYQLGNEKFLTDDGEVELAFRFIKIQFDFDGEKYQEFIEKQRENGKKGGRKRIDNLRAKNNPKNPPLENKPIALKGSHNENDNVKEKVKVKVNVKKKLPKAIVSKKPILKAKKVSGGKEGGFGDPAINDIIETIKKHHKIMDGTQTEARTYGKLLKDKIEQIDGFKGDYRGFVDDLIIKASKFTKQYTTSPKNIYYNLGKIIASEEQEIPQSKIPPSPKRIQAENRKKEDIKEEEESKKVVDNKNELKDLWETLGMLEKQTIIGEAMKNARANNPNTKEEYMKPLITIERNRILKERLGKK